MPLKGEVWEVNLDPAQGHEQAKIRPCVVISNDLVNTKMGLSIVVPFTGTAWYTKSGKLSPAMVEILPPEGGLTKPSYSMAFQVRTVSHSRFTNKLGAISAAKLVDVVRSVQEIVDH
ncbi:MAG: type II toxin-antitoxin system PemK/MazF family toxin [Candidatus Obscuribacterales bacterium]|jgi:mRNA interferase MazF|nr:type II toxin-antitoxin system PemK/MazF family toxin [Candidatus Obscuribacterales bacterium]